MKYFYLLTLASLFSVSSFAQLPSYVPGDSLVAYYPFSGNLDDISGNYLNGTGNPTYQVDRLNNSISALKLASGSNIKLPASLFNFGYQDSFTIAFWFSHNAGGDARIFSTENPEGNFRIANNGGGGKYIISFGGCCANAGYLYDTLASPNNWNHLVFAFKNRRGNLYINGKLKSTFRNNSFEKLNYGGKAAIGTKAGSSNDAWNGKFDDLGIWSRELTSLEVSNLYDRCPESSTDTITACDSYTWTNQITYYSSNTTAKDTFENLAKCDSIVTLNLTINYSTTSTDTISACDSFTWTNNVTYTASNTSAKDTLVNVAGCDSVVTLNLTINTVNDSVNATGNTLTSVETGAQYQWLDCENNYDILGGETGQSYVATANGSYAVQVNKNGCRDTSNCYVLKNVGLANSLKAIGIKVYPNPTEGLIFIEMSDGDLIHNLSISNGLGAEVLTQVVNTSLARIDMSSLPPGIYFLQITSASTNASIKLIKM
jgi:hypothetical protein